MKVKVFPVLLMPLNKSEDGEVTVQVKGKMYNPDSISRVSLSGVSDQ